MMMESTFCSKLLSPGTAVAVKQRRTKNPELHYSTETGPVVRLGLLITVGSLSSLYRHDNIYIHLRNIGMHVHGGVKAAFPV